MYEILTPTVPRVLALIEEPDASTASEGVVFDFLRRFVSSLLLNYYFNFSVSLPGMLCVELGLV